MKKLFVIFGGLPFSIHSHFNIILCFEQNIEASSFLFIKVITKEMRKRRILIHLGKIKKNICHFSRPLVFFRLSFKYEIEFWTENYRKFLLPLFDKVKDKRNEKKTNVDTLGDNEKTLAVVVGQSFSILSHFKII